MPTLSIRWHSNSVLSGLIVGKMQLLRVSLTIYKRVLAILGEATTEPLWPHGAALWPGCPVSWPTITSLCLLPTPWLDGLGYLPHGLLTQEIIEIAEEGINSLVLLEQVRSAREREREQLSVRPEQCARETVNCNRSFIGIINSLAAHYNHPALTHATRYNSCHHQRPSVVPWLTRVWKYYSALHKDLVTTNCWAEWLVFINVIPNSKSKQERRYDTQSKTTRVFKRCKFQLFWIKLLTFMSTQNAM